MHSLLLRHGLPHQPPRLPRQDPKVMERPQINLDAIVLCLRLAKTLLLRPIVIKLYKAGYSLVINPVINPVINLVINPVIPLETVIQEKTLQTPALDTSFELPVVSLPPPLQLEHGLQKHMTMISIQEK